MEGGGRRWPDSNRMDRRRAPLPRRVWDSSPSVENMFEGREKRAVLAGKYWVDRVR